MKKSRILKKLPTIVFSLGILAVIFTAFLPASAQKRDENAKDAAASDEAGLGTGVISLLPGQSVRISAVNVGGKAADSKILLVPVGEQGKATVPIQCNAIAAPGDAHIDTFTHPGGVNRMLFYVQIHANRNDIKDFVPSVEVFNTGPGSGPHFVLSGADFVSIRPIWVPS